MRYSLLLAVLAVTLCACGTPRGAVNVYRADAAASDNSGAINVGYGTVDRSELTYSVNQLDIDEKEIVSYSDIWEYMRGRVPGVVIGPPETGKTPSITVRGASSINLSTQPLIMVDGVETDDPSFLNPNDIGSVSVLKDASASIYGTRGANGVILITTKSAQEQAKLEAQAKKEARNAARAAREARRASKKN